MQIPELSTDKLYIFMVFVGLILILGSNLGVPYYKFTLLESQVKAETAMAIITEEYEFLNDKIDRYEKRLEKKSIPASSLIPTLDGFREKDHKLELERLMVAGTITLVKRKLETLEELGLFAWIPTVIGSFLVLIGLIWWIRVHQLVKRKQLVELQKSTISTTTISE